MKPGPAPKPAVLHVVGGNPSKKSAAELRPGLTPDVVLPDPPAHLAPEAQAEWKRLGAEMIRLGLISQLDRAAYAVYCQAWAVWTRATEKLGALDDAQMVEVTPSGYKQMSVWFQIANRAADQMHKFLLEFGMTPSARTRFTGLTPQLPLFPDEIPGAGAQKTANPASRHFS